MTVTYNYVVAVQVIRLLQGRPVFNINLTFLIYTFGKSTVITTMTVFYGAGWLLSSGRIYPSDTQLKR